MAARFRLVKYYNLPRQYGFFSYPEILGGPGIRRGISSMNHSSIFQQWLMGWFMAWLMIGFACGWAKTSVLLPDYLGINMNKMSFASIDPAK